MKFAAPTPAAGTARGHAAWGITVLPFLLALGLFWLRREQVIVTLEHELTCRACLFDRQWLADGPMLATFALLLALSLVLRAWWVRTGLRLLALAIALVYLADIYVYNNFFVRLQLRDAVIYGRKLGLVWDQFAQSQSYAALFGLGAALAVALLAAAWPAGWTPAPRRRPLLATAAAALLVAAVANAAWMPTFPSTWIVRNVFAHNLRHGVEVAYDDADVSRLHRLRDTLPWHCLSGTPSRPSVVLLVTESWSPYHSRLFSGINDWTPRMDAIAQRGRYFTNFHAGGENTNAGLISLLLGMDFYSPVNDSLSLAPFEGLWGRRSTLPRQLAAQGYDTVFMTTGDLSFSDKGAWLKDIGFAEVDGHDAPEYDGLPRLNFNAAPDEYLYRKALKYIAAPHPRPFLLVIENVSTHHPYTHPYSGIRRESAVFHYFDMTASRFYEKLAASGFLHENLLVVASDHRAMTRVRPREEAEFGASAPARIPAFIVSDTVAPGAVDAPLAQSDLLPSLVNRVAGRACSRQPVADMFAPAVAADRCLMHAPNSDWNVIKAYCGARTLTVHLDGSRSVVEADDGEVPADAAALKDAVAIRRLFPGVSRVLATGGGAANAAVVAP